MDLKFLHNKKIDKKKWDNCIKKSPNRLIYAYSWYLDKVAKKWSGIVANDYEYVLPIVWKRKIHIRYVYRPFLVQQLGVFGKNPDKIDTIEFIKILKRNFEFINYNFNFFNTNVQGVENKNYVLSMNNDFKTLYSNFSKNTKRNIKKSEKNNLKIDKNLSYNKLIKLKKENLPNKLTEKDFQNLEKLILFLNNNAIIYGVYKNDELVSAAFFAYHDRVFYYLIPANSNNGKKTGASFFLLKNFISENCNSNYLLDFEGSNIPGIERFFKGWGAKKHIYKSIMINNLPFYLKWFKK